MLENETEELEEVRAQIQAVIDARVDGSFTAVQADLYERLCDRESELLRTTSTAGTG